MLMIDDIFFIMFLKKMACTIIVHLVNYMVAFMFSLCVIKCHKRE